VLRDGLEMAEECGSPALIARARDYYAGRTRPNYGKVS
jgi:hypothetical protein